MLCRVILLVFIFLFLVFSNCNDTKKKESPKVVKGVLDLQEWDFSKDGFLSLDGEWEFYWKELLSPETNPAVDANKNLPKEIQYIPVPHVWNDFRVNGESIGKSGFGSYRLKIILPKQKDESSESQPSNISLALSNIASAHRIYVNGVLVGEKGKVGTSEEDSISFMQNYTIDLSRKLNQNKTNSDLNSVPFPNELNIIIHVSNFNFTRGGIWLPLKIGTIDSIQKLENRAFVLDLIVFSSLLIMGLYHLGLYFNRKKDKSPLYFGIFCILISLRTVSINQLMILDALPFVPYLIILKIEYFSFYFGTFAFAKFSQILFPEEFSKKWLRFITIILIPCSLAVILFPVSVYLNLLTLVQLITLIAIVYFVKVLILSSLKNKPGAKLSLFSFLIFALSVMNDILRSMGILYTPLLASYGFLSFVVFQAIILSHRFAFGFEMAEKLGLELSQKSDRLEETAIELKELTQNLEAKVLERTKRLEETQKEIQDLNEFTQKVNSLSNLDSIFTEISRYVYENYGILAVWLTLPDENKKFLYTYKIYSYEKLPDNKYNYLKTKNVLMLDKDGGMVYKTFLRKKPLYLNKFPKFEFDIDRELVDKLSLQSILLVPLVRKNESVGVLTFSNLNKEMKLSKNEIRKISNLCSQIAGAIDTNHLLEKVEKAKRQTLELNQLIKVLNEKSNLIEIMEMLSFYINGKYKFPYYILSILDSQTNMLKYAHAFLPTGLGEKEIEFIKSFNLPIDFNNKESIHSQALAEQKPLFLPDSSSGIKSNSGKYILSFLKQKSSVTLPIILQKKPIAILDLFSQESVSLIQEDLVELSIFAEQLAGIINGSLLFKEVLTEKEKVESARLEIEKLNEITRKINAESDLVNILEFIFSHLQEEYSIDGTIVLLKDEQEENLRSFHTSAPIVNPEMIDYSRKLVIPLTDKEGGILYKAFSKNRTLYLAKVSPNRADTELIKAMIETLKFTSFLAVPLQIKNESFGLVLMTSYTRSEKLKKEEIEKIENFCEHVSGAIYNSLLLKQTEKAQRETEKQKRETEELNKLIKSLNEDLNIQVIMKKVYEYLKENHKIHYYGLGVIDDKEEKIITIDTLSPEFLTDEERLRVSQFSTKINEKIGGHAFAYRSGKPFYIPKIRKGAMTEEEQYNQRVTKLESLLIIPLILQGNFIGFLDLYNVGRMELDKDDLNKLSILGEQLAGIIYSSSLLKKIQEEKRNADNTRQEIEKLNEFTRLINSTSDLSLIMNEVYSYLNQNFEITNVWTLLVDKNSNEFYTNENLSIYRGLESIDNNYFLSFRESINEKLGTMYQIFNTKNPIYISDFTKTIKGTKNEYFNEINGEIISGSKIDLKIILKGKLKTTLQLPLIVQDEVIGIISLSSPNTILKLTNIDLEKLIRFSNQIAGVIQNAQLLKETEKAKLEADLEKENAIVAQKETEKARKEIEKLNEFTKRINEKYDLDEMLDLVGEYIVTNFPISHYLLWKKDFDGKSLSPYKGTYSKDIPEENIKKFKELKIPLEYDEGVHASVCKNKKYLFMRGIKRHKSLSNIENTINELLDFDSLLVIPLINQNQVIGTMDFSNYSGKMSISKDEIKRIGIFCEQVSGVIHGAGLLKQAEEAKKNALVAQLETEKQKQETEELNKLIKSLNEELDLKVIMQKVLQYVNLHFHIQYYALYKSNKQNTHVEMEEANFPVHMTEENRINVLNLKIPIKNVKGVHAFPFKAKRPFFIPRLRESGGTEEENFIKRVYNISSIIVIPLILNNDIIGTIDFSSEQKLQLSKDDITKLSILGEQLAGIIHGSNLLKQVQEEKEKSESIRLEIEKLNELTKKINSTSDLDSILEIVFNYFEKEFGLLGFILGINNSTNQIHCLKTSSLEFSPEEVKFASNIQETLGPELGSIWAGIVNKKTLYINRYNEKFLTDFDRNLITNLKLKGHFQVPLIIHDEVIGIAMFTDRREKFAISKEVRKSVEQFCEQIAGAIYNAQLLKETEKARKETEGLNKLMKNVNSVSSLIDIMAFIMYYLEKQLQFREFSLLLNEETKQELSVFSFTSPRASKEQNDYFKNWKHKYRDLSGVFEKVVEEKKIVFCSKEDLDRDDTIARDWIDRGEFTYIILVPFIVYDELIGVLFVHANQKEYSITKEILTKLEKFSDLVAGSIFNAKLLKKVEEAKEEADTERNKSEKLLLNILPKDVAKELKEKGFAEPSVFESVSVMFTDFKGFTTIAETMSANELVKELDACFVQFDKITERYNLEKLKTIGDSYMCAGGIPKKNKTHAVDCVLASLEIQNFMNLMKQLKEERGFPYWELRLGIHSGPLVAGVIGERKFAYDVWGDTVNTASRMESSGTPGMINISGSTYQIVKDFFECEYRGKVNAKNKGEVDMYYVHGLKPEYTKEDGRTPNGKFWELYGG